MPKANELREALKRAAPRCRFCLELPIPIGSPRRECSECSAVYDRIELAAREWAYEALSNHPCYDKQCTLNDEWFARIAELRKEIDGE